MGSPGRPFSVADPPEPLAQSYLPERPGLTCGALPSLIVATFVGSLPANNHTAVLTSDLCGTKLETASRIRVELTGF